MYDEHFGVERVVLIDEHAHSVFCVVVNLAVGQVVLVEFFRDVSGHLVLGREFFYYISV